MSLDVLENTPDRLHVRLSNPTPMGLTAARTFLTLRLSLFLVFMGATSAVLIWASIRFDDYRPAMWTLIPVTLALLGTAWYVWQLPWLAGEEHVLVDGAHLEVFWEFRTRRLKAGRFDLAHRPSAEVILAKPLGKGKRITVRGDRINPLSLGRGLGPDDAIELVRLLQQRVDSIRQVDPRSTEQAV